MRDKGRVGVNPSLAAGSGWLFDQLVGWLVGWTGSEAVR